MSATVVITMLSVKQAHRLKMHPAANLLPWMTGPERAEFKRDVSEHGIREPAWVWQEPGKDFLWLMDGRNRRAVCAELGLDLPVRHWDGNGSPALFVASLNFNRRMLSAQQRLTFAHKLKKELEREARQRQAHGQTGPGRTLPANWQEANGTAAAKAAEIAGVSERSVGRMGRVMEQAAPELRKALEKEEVTVSDVERIINLPAVEQLEALKKVQAKAARTLAAAVEKDDTQAAVERGTAKLKAARKLFCRLEGKAAQQVVGLIDRALELAEEIA